MLPPGFDPRRVQPIASRPPNNVLKCLATGNSDSVLGKLRETRSRNVSHYVSGVCHYGAEM